jgi:hypothetical protein
MQGLVFRSMFDLHAKKSLSKHLHGIPPLSADPSSDSSGTCWLLRDFLDTFMLSHVKRFLRTFTNIVYCCLLPVTRKCRKNRLDKRDRDYLLKFCGIKRRHTQLTHFRYLKFRLIIATLHSRFTTAKDRRKQLSPNRLP